MSRARIVAGRAVIIVEASDMVDKGLNKIRSKLHRFSNTVGAMGESMFRTGFFGAIGSGVILKSFAKFDDLMLELQARMGMLGRTTKQQETVFKNLEERIRELGRSTSYTAQEVATAAIELAKAGFDETTGEISNTLQAVLDLARGAKVTLATSATIAANAMRAFNLDTATSNIVASQFIKAIDSGTLSIDDLAESLKFASATSVELGESLPLVLGAMTLIAQKGLRGSIAGTSFNAALQNLAKKSKQISEDLGVDVAVNSKGFLDLATTLSRLNEATKDMPPLQRVGVFNDLFNLRGSRSFLPTSKDIDELLRLTNSIAGAGNQARLAAQKMDEGLGGAARMAISALQDVILSLGKATKSTLIPLLKLVRALSNELNKLVASNPALAAMVVFSPAILLGAGLGFIALAKAVRIAAYAVGGLRSTYVPLMAMFSKGTAQQIAFLSGLGRLPKAAKKSAAKPKKLSKAAINRAAVSSLGYSGPKAGAAAVRMQYTAKQAAMLKRAAQQQKMMGKMVRARGVADSSGYFAKAAKFSAASKNVIPKRSMMGMMFAGGNLITKGARSMAVLSKSFLGFGRVLRMVGGFFSTGGLLTIAEFLFLFGDKVPYVRDALNDLSKAFGGFFKELGKIGTFMKGPIDLIRAAFAAFSNDQDELGMQALTRAVSFIGQIIKTQVVAAWERFRELVGSTGKLLFSIGQSVWQVVSTTFQQIGVVLGTVFDTIKTGFDIIGANGETPKTYQSIADSIRSVISAIAITTVQIIGELVQAIERAATRMDLSLIHI